MKKLLISSLILIIVPTIIFVPLCLVIYYNSKTNNIDYTERIIGCWEAFQYYTDSELYLCSEQNKMLIQINSDTIAVTGTGTLLPNVKNTDYTWESSTAITFGNDVNFSIIYISFNSMGNLQIKTKDNKHTILLRRLEQ